MSVLSAINVLVGCHWTIFDTRQIALLAEEQQVVHNAVLFHWADGHNPFSINGLGVVFDSLHPLQTIGHNDGTARCFFFARIP
jgi:hypothetical protein